MLFQKFIRLLSTPGMMSAWTRWMLPRALYTPTLCQSGGALIQGFQNFSEFWGARNLLLTEREKNFIDRYAATEGMLLDVGANLGYISLALSALRPQGTVHAFEPSPVTYKCLQHNLALNKVSNVATHQLAVGGEAGTFKFSADENSPTTSRLEPSTGRQGGGKAIDVSVTTLDAFLRDKGGSRVGFLKVDVEGFEVQVIKGAVQLLKERRCAAGLIELCPYNLEGCGNSVEALVEAVLDVGYELRFILDNGDLGHSVTVKNAAEVVVDNVALVPASY